MSEEKIEAPQSQKVLGDKILGAHNNPTKDYEYVDWVIIATPFTIYDNKTKKTIQL